MSADLERDLGAWAAGALSRERLVATYGAEAAGTVAVHDRLTELAGGMPIPDAEAGWAALVARIEAAAPVVPLRRHDRGRRTVSLLIAAALMVGGSAFAAVRSWTPHDPVPSRPSQVVTDVGTTFGPSDRGLVPPLAPTAPAHDGHPSSRTHHGHVGSDASGPSGTGDGSSSVDDPNDRDHGTGNDGSHDDQGGGNDGPSGSGQDGQGGNQGASGDQQGGSQGQDSQ